MISPSQINTINPISTLSKTTPTSSTSIFTCKKKRITNRPNSNNILKENLFRHWKSRFRRTTIWMLRIWRVEVTRRCWKKYKDLWWIKKECFVSNLWSKRKRTFRKITSWVTKRHFNQRRFWTRNRGKGWCMCQSNWELKSCWSRSKSN
jgi:hypothetical protein